MSCKRVGGLLFGQGLPKICVPLTESGTPALLREMQRVRELPADLIEWRIDRFFSNPLPVLPQVREFLNGIPLLGTIRTKAEGGEGEYSPEEYERAVYRLIESGGFEFVDIELACGEQRVSRLVQAAKEAGVATVLSKHYFGETPGEKEMLSILRHMVALGGDLPKLAVMPQSPQDVLNLLQVTAWATEELGPVITMSMGELGKISRVSGQYFGSCLTFGAGISASAPGQIAVEDLKAVMLDIRRRDAE